jgi:CRISPR type III-A-associated protein Csm2
MAWKEPIPQNEIEVKVTKASVDFAKRFGEHLGTSDTFQDKNGREKSADNKLTTSQLRKFFGEVKRQQMEGYNPTRFVLLKPKLAYAVGRTEEKKQARIKEFYDVISGGIDRVQNEQQFKNFIMIFEAIVAYHKFAEGSKQ